MPVRGDPDNLFIGQSLPVTTVVEDLRGTIHQVSLDRFDFVALPLAVPGGQGSGANFQPAVESQLALDAATWQSSVVGLVSEELDLDAVAGGPDAAEHQRACLETELRWATHLHMRAVLLPPPAPASRSCGYARAVNELLLEGLFNETTSEESPAPLALRVPADSGGWLAWNRFRSLCDHHPRLAVALELGAGKSASSERELQRWLGEPVRFVILHPGAFLTNRQGFPVLPRRLKALLLGLFRHEVDVIIASPGKADEPAAPAAAAAEDGAEGGDASETGKPSSASAEALQTYVARLFQSLPALTSVERFAKSHLDTLQAPLQPLQDNLESETYEIFETDPVKYALYEEAVLALLRDRLNAGRTPPFTVMVLGAGRGPLVAASLRAAQRAETEVKIWAVEKNPNAVHALRHRKRREEDWDCVDVIAEDMRVWKAPRKADALVSELLGSFGDNELSPECLDGAQHLLADDGVCIPQSYVSSLAPVSASAAWADARGQPGGGNGGGMAGGDSGQLETAYVVCLHKAFYPASGPKDCFSYKHPKQPVEESNDRTAEIAFEAEVDSLVHGFAAYFDCTLYGDVRMSIHPETASEGMFSWFPMFFPLQVPVFLRKGDTLRSHWWRRHDARRVWYEWALSEPSAASVQNPGGRSWAIGL